MLIDAHNHLQDPRFDGDREQIVSEMKSVGIDCCIVNGTEPSDWQSVVQLAHQHPTFVRASFGLHPWKIKARPVDWFEQLRGFLLQFPNAGVGECGLDRWIENHDIEDQRIVFRAQLALAQELDRPCTIHCLKAWAPLMEELRQAKALPRFLLHSFGGSIETAKELVALGGYFSFSGYFLHPRKRNLVEVFRQIPSDRILLETDAPDMLPPDSHRKFGDDVRNHPANMSAVYERFFALTSINTEQLYENTDRWWSGNNA
jgi:TatD DNase family protein